MPAKKKTDIPSFVPDWAKDAIWYQIFPERFRNGTRRNDPRLTDMKVTRKLPGWKIMPWGSDWYSLEPWEKKVGGFFDTVYLRRYGGDLVGVREKLGYLQDLGINSIYLNPIFMAPSLHKYDASCFHHIDPTLGPDRDGDLRRIAKAKETEDPATWVWTKADRYFVDLVAEIHRRGMRVIIDGVFNHTGQHFFAFQDLLAKGKASRYRDWYKIKSWKDDKTFEYDGWFGHKALPEFGRTETNLAKPVRDYVFNITRRWMDPDGDGDPSDGIDGWRLDVAFCVPHLFWKQWRKLCRSINPECYLTAEIVALAQDYLKGDEFDAVMNYMWLYPTTNFFSPSGSPIGAGEFREKLDEIRKAYPAEVSYVLQNLTDSHDVGRMSTMLENAFPPIKDFGQYFELTRLWHHRDLNTRKPSRATFDILRQVAVFQATYFGAPMIYYGTEVGMWGANDPCDRQAMLWPDVRYSDEIMGINGPVKPRSRAPDKTLFQHYKKAFRLRSSEAALRRGSLTWLPSPNDRVAVFERKLGSDRILVALNAGDKPARLSVKGIWADLWAPSGVTLSGELDIDPRGWLVLKRL